MKDIPIADLVEPVSSWNPRKVAPERRINYIDLSAVDNLSKTISGTTSLIGSDAPSRARQLVSAGDILVSTVRPNLNAVAMVPDSLDGATASTGFCVLRPGDAIDRRYLFHWVCGSQFIESMTKAATGASYPAVSDRIVKASPIPAPPIDEQRRIAAILDRAAQCQATRSRILGELDRLGQSIYLDMFGDVQAVVEFGDVANLVGGRNLVADDPGADSDYRVLKISAVTSGTFRSSESKPLPIGYVPPSNHLVRRGDLLMSRANTEELVGSVAMVDCALEKLALPDKIWRLDFWDEDSDARFYQAMLQSSALKRSIRGLASGTGGSMKNISKAKLQKLLIPKVEVSRQVEFSRTIQNVAKVRSRHERAGELEIAAFASLRSRAFRGEL